MFKKKLENIFLTMMILSVAVLSYNWYQSHLFDSSPISDKYRQLIAEKESEVLQLMQRYYGFRLTIPLIITDKLPGKSYGVTAYDNGQISIYLNKKAMRESLQYMLDDVIAHEYAHALMFKRGSFVQKSDGHSAKWQKVCQDLGGSRCDRYVNHDDVVMGKMPF